VNLTQKQKLLLAIGLIVVVAMGAVYYKLKPRLLEYQQASEDVKNARMNLEQTQQRYYNRDNPVEVINTLRAAVGPWKREIDRANRIYNAREEKVPEDTAFPGFYYREKYREIRNEVLEKAQENNVPIPPDFGFSDVIPDNDSVELLLNQMRNAQFVLGVLIDGGVLEVSEFVVGAPILHEGFVQFFPFKVTVLMTMENLVKFLYGVKQKDQYLSVWSIGLRGETYPDGSYVRVEMVLFTTRLLDVEIAVAQQMPGGPMAGGMMGPMGRMFGPGGPGGRGGPPFGPGGMRGMPGMPGMPPGPPQQQ